MDGQDFGPAGPPPERPPTVEPAWGPPPQEPSFPPGPYPPPAPPRRSWRRHRALLFGGVGVLVLALAAGLALALTSGSPSTRRPTLQKPFAAALYALNSAPEVHYQADVAAVGDVDVRVTSQGEMVGKVTEGGDSYGLLRADGKVYLKPPASGLPDVKNPAAKTAMKGKWLTGHDVDSLLGSVPTQLVPPAKLASRLGTALGQATKFPPAGARGTLVDGVRVLSASTPLGVLDVTRNSPYRVVRLTPRTTSTDPSSSAALSFRRADAPGREHVATVRSAGSVREADDPVTGGMEFPAEEPGDVGKTYDELKDGTRELADAVDSDLQFSLKGDGHIHCSAGGCDVTVTVENSLTPGSSGAKITGGRVDARLTASITIEGEPAGGCSSTGRLPLNGSGEMECGDSGAGGVFSSVQAEKKAQAEAESRAEGGAEVPYSIRYGGQYYVYATAQVDVERIVREEDKEAATAKQLESCGTEASSASAKCTIDPRKLDYLFNKDIKPNDHNSPRAAQNDRQLHSIGINDTPEMRRYLTEQLMSAPAQGFDRTFTNKFGKFGVTNSVLWGPQGSLGVESTWQILDDGGYRFSTAIMRGVNSRFHGGGE